jgi:hypothetical protein
MYAVDSLRQLSLKFLSKDEMAGFNFQRMFLKPFEIIMLRNSNTEVREFILSSLNHLLLAKAPNVRSGWKSIFAVFAIAGGLEEEMICQQAYNALHRLVQNHFVLLVHDFPDLVACLLKFVMGPYTEIALGALNLIHHCAANLAEGVVPVEVLAMLQRQSSSTSTTALVAASPTLSHSTFSEAHDPAPPQPPQNPSGVNESLPEPLQANSGLGSDPIPAVAPSDVSGGVQQFGDGEPSTDEVAKYPYLRLWWPILKGLATMIVDERLTVRSTALAQFEDILHHYGRRFSTTVWERLLVSVLFPLVKSAVISDQTIQPVSSYPAQTRAAMPPMRPSLNSWVATTARNVLSSVVTLFVEHLWFPDARLRGAPSQNQFMDSATSGLHPLLFLFLNFISDITTGAILTKSGTAGIRATTTNRFIGGVNTAEGRPSNITNCNALKGVERTDSELLARIGMATLHELIMALSGALNSNFDESLASDDGTVITKCSLWHQIAIALTQLMEFGLSTDFGSVPRDVGNLTDDEDDEEEEEEEEEEEQTKGGDGEDGELRESGEEYRQEGGEGKKEEFCVKNNEVRTNNDGMTTDARREDEVRQSPPGVDRGSEVSGASRDKRGDGKPSSRDETATASVTEKTDVSSPSLPFVDLSSSSGETDGKLSKTGGIEVLPNLGFVMTQLVLTLKLVDQMRVLLDLHTHGRTKVLTVDTTRMLLHSLRDAALHARAFNANVSLRTALWRCGFMELPLTRLVDEHGRAMYGNQGSGGRALRLLPHLFEQEASANRHLLSTIFKLYTGDDADDYSGDEVDATDARDNEDAAISDGSGTMLFAADGRTDRSSLETEKLLQEVGTAVLTRFAAVEQVP